MKHRDVTERFLDKVSPEPNSGCWLWTASTFKNTGYGQFYIGPEWGYAKGMTTAHRASWHLFKGEIPDGLHIDHLCNVRCCVNPDHLEPVTHEENTRRALLGKELVEHCHRGHEYNEFNTYRNSRGHRECRVCRAFYRKRRQLSLRSRTKGRKLTAEDAREIKQLYRSGLSQSKIAMRYGVGQTMISRIVIGHAWKHVI